MATAIPTPEYVKLNQYYEGSNARVSTARVVMIAKKEGGTCEHCGNSRLVIAVRPMDMFLCAHCLSTWDGV